MTSTWALTSSAAYANQINVEPELAVIDREVSAFSEAAASQFVDTTQWHNRISKRR